MIRDALNRLLELAKIEQFSIGGRDYTSENIFPVRMPTPDALIVHTLSGFVDYIKGKVDPVEKEKIFIQVFSPVKVRLLGEFKANSFYERPAFLLAEFEPTQINTGQYQALEDFIINLQAHFFPNDTRASILKVVGNIKDSAVQQFEDDGITQSVTAKAGIAIVESVKVPNPVTLKPYRTFPEIEQPESLFVFRMKSTRGEAPLCGLWEADNKLWKVEAIKRIAAWLKEKLPEVPIIA